MNPQETQNWTWVIDVIFGTTFSLGFLRLDLSVRQLSRKSIPKVIEHVFGAIGFIIFAFYYITAYHFLVKIYPYTIHPLSVTRLLMDLFIAFQAMIILTRALYLDPQKQVINLLIAMSAGHIAASVWHACAVLEYKAVDAVNPIVFAPHYIFIAIYWSVYLVWWFWSSRAGYSLENFRRVAFILISLTVMCVAVFRYLQLYAVYG